MFARRLAVPVALVFFAFALLASSGPPPALGQSPPANVPGEVLVKFRGASESTVASTVRDAGAAEVEYFRQIGVRRLRGTRGQSAEDLLARLRGHPLVEFAEVNGYYTVDTVPNDPRFGEQWAPQKINAPAAWDIAIGSADGLVAILDTGVDYNHPDLAGKVILGPDYQNGDNDPMDDNGHGTRMSGIAAAATNNGAGVAGLNWLAKILAVKVCSSGGSCSWSALASGITYAADRGARAISISIGGSSGSSTLQSALQYAWSKGAVIACSAGNSNSNGPHYPSDYPQCLSVGATDSGDNKASFSNWGPNLDVMAPGVSILTTTPGGGYTGSSGTSPAAPHVAGLASVLFAHNPSLDNCRVSEIIKSTATDLGAAGWDEYYGNGRINALAAVLTATGASACSTPPPPPPPPAPGPDNPPTVQITSPGSGATVSGRVAIQAMASDDRGVARVEFWVDSELVATDTTAPFEGTWNTRPKKWTAGSHAIKVVAVDTAGQRTEQTASVTLQK